RATSARYRMRRRPGSGSGPATAPTRTSATTTPVAAPRCRSSPDVRRGSAPARRAPFAVSGSVRTKLQDRTMRGVRIMTTGKRLAGLLLLSTALTHPALAQEVDSEAVAAAAPEPEDGGEPTRDGEDVSVPGGDVIF